MKAILNEVGEMVCNSHNALVLLKSQNHGLVISLLPADVIRAHMWLQQYWPMINKSVAEDAWRVYVVEEME
ncbi:hypothetical protein [Shimia thalassica]|uniref:hypothetical protein n=1 Tax=Shimia thalassica TaxID=1715693 RepID=UPI002733AAFE|nr:hypothetical protein [Shimia thalassica]MDP2518832.1 hypothetical protein [Shimia thalassica]